MSETKEKKIRVMVVEDSAYMRYVLSEILSEAPDIEVIEKARDGLDALERLETSLPDVITLDIQMPRMDGLTFLSESRKKYRIPTIMISSLTYEGAEDTIKALEMGAVDFVPKPSGVMSLTLEDIKEEMIRKVRMASSIKPMLLRDPEPVIEPEEKAYQVTDEAAPSEAVLEPKVAIKVRIPLPEKVLALKKVVVIGCSTGGPRALTEIIPLLPSDLSACVIIVQHMPPRFTTSLAERLNAISAIEVSEAKNGDKVTPGTVYVAPGDFHIRVGRSDTIYLSQESQKHGVRPSVDVLMKSIAETYGRKALGVVLTGMGVDGKEGSKAMKDAGSTVFAEHESSCVVYGMPRAVIESGCADRIFTLSVIADEIIRHVES
ncbi:MAG TPA: chemotaxis response regulator protein-glutamate methylesterase [bacterium]|nr:chemotaxis response regulator protein-glutamate methylesterase [bacterium]